MRVICTERFSCSGGELALFSPHYEMIEPSRWSRQTAIQQRGGVECDTHCPCTNSTLCVSFHFMSHIEVNVFFLYFQFLCFELQSSLVIVECYLLALNIIFLYLFQSFFEGQTAPWDSAKMDENRMKNRYGNIIACVYKNTPKHSWTSCAFSFLL